MNEIDVSDLDDRNVDNYIQTSNEATKKVYDWVRHAISVIAIILGLVISLKTTKSENILEFYLFSISVTLCGLSILCGLFFLYSEADTLYRHSEQYMKHIQTRDETGGRKLEESDPRKIFDISRKAFFFLLILSILSLIGYAVFSNFPNYIHSC